MQRAWVHSRRMTRYFLLQPDRNRIISLNFRRKQAQTIGRWPHYRVCKCAHHIDSSVMLERWHGGFHSQPLLAGELGIVLLQMTGSFCSVSVSLCHHLPSAPSCSRRQTPHCTYVVSSQHFTGVSLPPLESNHFVSLAASVVLIRSLLILFSWPHLLFSLGLFFFSRA